MEGVILAQVVVALHHRAEDTEPRRAGADEDLRQMGLREIISGEAASNVAQMTPKYASGLGRTDT